ncbi:preprotein translocase subunit SecE [Mycobacterium sp.]|uniref:preprotein translocase subunit SecE n=1 Tax=Mycobacterium sp. TaxID=1785 RepID=UPI003C7952C4
MSDESDVADDAASDGGDAEDSGGRTAVVTKPVARPQRPTGKRSRLRAADADDEGDGEESSTKSEVSTKDKKDKKDTSKDSKAKKGKTAKKTKKAGSSGARSANPIAFVYTYLKQVVAEMRKVIWPNRRQMVTYTGVVLAFLAFMVALVGLADFGLTKLVLLVFG